MLPNSIVLLVCYSTFVYFPLEEKDNCLLTTPPTLPCGNYQDIISNANVNLLIFLTISIDYQVLTVSQLKQQGQNIETKV